MSFLLSKSKLQAFVQCKRRLWLSVHHNDAAEDDDMAALLLSRGTAFGEAIQVCFPSGQRIEARSPDDAVKQTRQLFERFAAGAPRVPIFEAAFAYGEVVIYADVLEPCDDGTWCLLEVKSSVLKPGEAPKPHYVRDAATQAWVLRQCGLPVSRVELVQADGEFVLPKSGAVDGILHRVDVSTQALALADEVPHAVDAALATVRDPCEPARPVGAHCNVPNKCSFIRHCSAARLREGEQIVVPVWHLAGEPSSRIVATLMQEGYRDLAQVPEDRLEKPMHRTMRRIARGEPPYVDARLLDHLRQQPFPRYFLDYETNNPPLPLWRGTRPGERVPFQFSVHKWTSLEGQVEHVSFLADTLDDPRPELARRLDEAMVEPGPVYAWNGNSTEGPITLELARAFPRHAAVLERVGQSCKKHDPRRQFREWFYHPAMEGSWGLKAIARALFAESPYKKLHIANGVDAMREYERFLSMPAGPDRETLRQGLLDYCNTDTEIMISVWRALTD
jgi:hypothetical protein